MTSVKRLKEASIADVLRSEQASRCMARVEKQTKIAMYVFK